jgi:hypothetical protein
MKEPDNIQLEFVLKGVIDIFGCHPVRRSAPGRQ